MTPEFLVVIGALAIAQLVLSKEYAFLPLVLAACHLGNIEFLPQLTPTRFIILIGLSRALNKGFFKDLSARSNLDVCFIVFTACALLSTIGHKPDPWTPSPLSARLGLVLNVLGAYLYGRVYLPDMSALLRYAKVLPFVLIPLAALMAVEYKTRQNLYYRLGARSEVAVVREDRIRAKGPFRNPILAGAAGATCLPFAYLLWQLGRKRTALLGLSMGVAIVLACSSSGPLAAVAVTLASIFFWPRRTLMKVFLVGCVVVMLLYPLVKGRGPWYLMAHIDLVGGSTGWHRAKLIDQGYKYLDEWWLWGTDYTRHWMASGVSWNPNMVDLTNYYLHLGVIGGLPLTACLVTIIVVAFRTLGRRMGELHRAESPDEIVLWCAGASLGTHAIMFVSISYFDQIYVFFYILLGAIPGLVASSSLGRHFAAPKLQEEEPVEARPLRYYS